MKHFNKALVAASLAAITTFTSCVDNEVSPDVAKLREAQAGFVSAKAQFEAASAAREQAEADYRAAETAILTADANADLQIKMAGIDKAAKEAEIALAKAALQLDSAVVAMELEIISMANDAAKGHLEDYKDEIAEVATQTGLKLAKQTEIARAKLMLKATWDANGNLVGTAMSWDQYVATLEAALEVSKNDLKSKEEALVSLQEVLANPSTAQAELTKLEAEINAHNDKAAALKIDSVKATQVVTAAQAPVTANQAPIDAYNTVEAQLNSEEEVEFADGSINIGVNLQIADAEALIAETELEIVPLEEELARRQARLTEYEAALSTYIATVETATEANFEALEAEKDARVPYDIAQNEFQLDMPGVKDVQVATKEEWIAKADGSYKFRDYTVESHDDNYAIEEYDGVVGEEEEGTKDDHVQVGTWVTEFQDEYDALIDPNNTVATQAEKDAALANLNKARAQKAIWDAAMPDYTAAYTTYKAVYDDVAEAKAAVTVAENALAAHEADIEKLKVAVANQQTLVDAKIEEILEPKQAELALLVELKAELDADLASKKAAFEEATAAMPALKETLKTATAAKNDIVTAMAKEKSMSSDKTAVTVAIKGYIGTNTVATLEAAITTKKNQIKEAKEAIVAAEADIVVGKFDKAVAEAKIAKLEGELAEIQAKIDLHLSLAAQYKALMDAALAVN